MSAKFVEKGGADLIIIYNSGRFRMAGRGSLAGMMPYGDANATVLDMVSPSKDVQEMRLSGSDRSLTSIYSTESRNWKIGYRDSDRSRVRRSHGWGLRYRPLPLHAPLLTTAERSRLLWSSEFPNCWSHRWKLPEEFRNHRDVIPERSRDGSNSPPNGSLDGTICLQRK